MIPSLNGIEISVKEATSVLLGVKGLIENFIVAGVESFGSGGRSQHANHSVEGGWQGVAPESAKGSATAHPQGCAQD